MCLRNYRKSILQLRTSVLGRLRDLQLIFAITSGTLVFIIITFLRVFSIFQDTLLEVSERLRDTDKGNQLDIIEINSTISTNEISIIPIIIQL